MAESFHSLGKNVTLIQRSDQLATIFDLDMATIIHQEAEKHQISLILGEEVEGFSGDKRVNTVITNKGSYSTDLVLLSVGVKPNTDFFYKILPFR